MKAAFSRLIAFLKSEKRTIVSFSGLCVIFFISFISCSLFSLATGNSSYESVAKKMGNDVYECEVVSSKPNDNLRLVFDKADDLAGREIKDSIDTYVLSYSIDDQYPAIISIADVEINADSILQYTTWDFSRYNYGFKTLSGAEIRNIEPGETYLNSHIAREVAIEIGCKEKDLIGKTIQIKTNLSKTFDLFIVDIVTNMDSINLGPYFQYQKCLITNYSRTANSYTNLKYVTVLRSGYLAKNYAIHQIENTVRYLNKDSSIYSSFYRRLLNNQLIDNGIQQLMDNTKSLFNGQNKGFLVFSIIPIAVVVFLSVASHYGKVKSEFFSSLFVSLTLFAIFVHFICPYIIISGHIISLVCSLSSMILILNFVILITSYYLFKQESISIQRKGNKRIIRI